MVEAGRGVSTAWLDERPIGSPSSIQPASAPFVGVKGVVVLASQEKQKHIDDDSMPGGPLFPSSTAQDTSIHHPEFGVMLKEKPESVAQKPRRQHPGFTARETSFPLVVPMFEPKQRRPFMVKSYFRGIRALLAMSVGAVLAAGSAPADNSSGPTPYPDPGNGAAWPGKGVIRSFGFMLGERKAFWTRRQQDQGAVVFVGDSLTGGWKNLAKDFPRLKVANRGVGGDVSRGVLFRFQEHVLDLNPRAVVIEIGNNDLTAMGSSRDMLSNFADMLAKAEKQKPGMPVVLCSIPSSANPKAPVKADDRKAMNEGIRKMASEHKNTHFCDLYTATANADGSPKLEYFASDKLHLSEAGHTKWAELLSTIFAKQEL